MSKRNRIIYWIANVWLSLGMVSTGIVQLIQVHDEAVLFARLGYPAYLMPMLGVWKLLGVIAVLLPRLPLLKEWAYAGFFFCMSGAIVSHVIAGGEPKEFFGPALLIALTFTSWYFRPSDRRLSAGK